MTIIQQVDSTVLLIIHYYYIEHLFNNKKCFLNSKPERSCDTEDWRNDAEKSALPSQE